MAVIEINLESGLQIDPLGNTNLTSPAIGVTQASDTQISILKANGYYENFFGTGLSQPPGVVTRYTITDANDQEVISLSGIDFIFDTTTTAAEVVLGVLNGPDLVTASAGPDQLFTLEGSDTVFAGAGADVIYGNGGRDLIYGNQDRDVLFGGRDDDQLYAGAADDAIYGNNGRDMIYGNRGDDALFGGQDSDFIYGGQGQDSLFGNKGDDVLFGNNGDDTLIGGAGDDVLTGGGGRDAFLFAADGSTDYVLDFTAGEDLLVVASAPEIIEQEGQTVLRFNETLVVVQGVSADDLTGALQLF